MVLHSSSHLPLPSAAWVVWLEPLHLLVKTEAKKIIEYLSLLHILGNQVSCFLPERAHIFPSLPFITDVPIEAFLDALDILARINSIRALVFLTYSLTAQTDSLYSSQATCPHFLCRLLFVVDFFQEFLVHPCRPPGVFA